MLPCLSRMAANHASTLAPPDLKGHHSRLNTYENYTHNMLPRMERLKYDQGYELGQVAPLCWAPIPAPSLRPKARMKFLATEAAFTCIFFSAFAAIMDSTWSVLMPWTRQDVSWLPLNTHLPLNERIRGDLELSSEELEVIHTQRVTRTKQLDHAAYKRRTTTNRVQYLESRRAATKKWSGKNTGSNVARTRKSRANALRTRKFHCSPCNASFADPSSLKRHLASRHHDEQVKIANGELALSNDKTGRRPAPPKHWRTRSSTVHHATKPLPVQRLSETTCPPRSTSARHPLTSRAPSTVPNLSQSFATPYTTSHKLAF